LANYSSYNLNINQQTTFQLYGTIDNVVVSGLLTDNKIMGINISNNHSKNDGPQSTLNMIRVNQTMSSLQTIRLFVESVESVLLYSKL